MSIKKLFGSTDKSRNYLAETDEKNAFKDVESAKNMQEIAIRQETFVPQIDYSRPENFAKFGSAYQYYKSAVERIVDFYPYDGSDYEFNQFYNKSLDIEKYIFNNLYPRTNGYANLDSSSYIDLSGGPHSSSATTTAGLFKDPHSSKRASSNIYDVDIYATEGLPTDYGSGTRESNLRANFDTGVTVEFWLKSKDLAADANSVVFDMWNNNASGTLDSGRLTIEILSASSGTPFRFTAQSGAISGTLFQQSVGQTIASTTLDSFNHYAFVFQNSGSYFVTKLYLNGYLNDTVTSVASRALGELPSKDMQARIGSFLTVPFRADAAASTRAAGTHLLTGSVDEFRYWKVARNGEDIGRNWFTHVRGGTNTDISNTTLGVYYKFNEGTTDDSTIDSRVLDYSGRLSNGAWTGTPSRTLSSAIVETSASAAEFKDPIIYSTHPEVVTLKNGLLNSGSWHDGNNNASFHSLIPSWVIEEHETLGNANPEIISHIIGSYFDKLYMQISALTTFKQLQNTSASYTPLPMAQHLPQSLGLYTPELFIDADVISRFLNRTEDFNFDSDLTDVKNLIYQNLYNNLAHIYKAKGTEKAIRNIFRCFYIDDKIIRFNTYTDNVVYDLKNNLQQTVTNKNSLNFNSGSNYKAVVYQKQDPDNTAESRGYISGSEGIPGYEDIYGFTAEVDVLLPSYRLEYDTFDRNFISCSIFGMHSASVDDAGDTTTFTADNANFQVYAMRPEKYSKDVYFKLTSSVSPHPFSDLTSSIFFNVYDNENWNLSVRLRPSNWPLTEIVSGSDIGYTYDVIFQGVNTKLGSVENSFTVSSSVTKAVGQSMLNAAKRIYVGARRTNITGAVLNESDILVTNTRYWAKYLDDLSLQQHIYDIENSGISGSHRNISPLDANNKNLDILNRNTLVLDWNFNDLTASDGTGNFFTQDVSSGSAQIRSSYGWMGKLSGYLHSGYGYGFAYNTTNIVDKRSINAFKFIDPEQAISSNMIKVLSGDDVVYGFPDTIPNYHHTLEKSPSAAISEEMLNFFAGVVDFNNLIGEPVNRYRERYKGIEKLREAFFRRVTSTTHVEDYMTYYQWFDDALSAVVAQFIPASGKFTEDVLNTIESHALERNKYKSQFPTIEFRADDPLSPALGINEKTYNWKLNHHPISDLQRDNSNWWRDRATRAGSSVISSGDSDVDAQRDIIRDTIENDNNQKTVRLSTISDGSYLNSTYVLRKLSKPYKLKVERKMSPVPPIKGGVNFEQNKRIGITYNALYPAGPVNHDGGIFVPENVLFGQALHRTTGLPLDLVGLKNSTDPVKPRPGDKVKRRLKVQHGRDWHEGVGYESAKSDIVFPFNIISASVTTGYNRHVVEKVSASLVITNLHNDVYGDDMEKPMQGPFTEYAVGGHQSRHIKLNTPASDAAAATGYITLAKLPQNNDTITISDGGTSIVFTFKSSPGAASTDVEIDGIFETRGYLRVAINEQDWNIAATETESPAANTVALRNIDLGGHGTNVAITKTESVSDTYTLSGMEGGAGPRYGLADYKTRPEAWKLLLGYCPSHHGTSSPITGAIGMVGADYPWPEANAIGAKPYPMTASQKAVYYRDFVAKRPVNIRNIHHTTGSTVLGNYNHNYDFVQAPGGWSNPRQFVESQPNLPTRLFTHPMTSSTSVRTLLDIYRGAIDGEYQTVTGNATGHTDFSTDYSTAYLESTTNNSVIVSKFSAPGGIEVMSKGYQDFRSGEFSVYNSLNNRNLTVKRPFQHHGTGTIRSATEAGLPSVGEVSGTRVYDIHGIDTGFSTHAARHAARFFRDSALIDLGLEPEPGTTYIESGSFHRVHRNNITRPKIVTEETGTTIYECASVYDNLNLSHPIPRSDRQYAWMTGAMLYTDPCNYRYSGFMPVHGEQAGYYSASSGYEPWMTMISASDFGVVNISNTYNTFLGAVSSWDAKVDFIPQDFAGLNTLIYEPINSSTNTLGYSNTVPIFSRDTSYPRIYTNRSFVGQTAFIDGAAAATVIRGTVSGSTLNSGFAYWPDVQLPGYMFNSLMLKRNGPYGWGTFNQMRQGNHPVLRNERSSSQLSIGEYDRSLENYNLPAVSMRGRPAIINYSPLIAIDPCGDDTPPGPGSITLKSTDNNQKIFFNDTVLNDKKGIDPASITTPFDHLILALRPVTFNENYLIYTENIFPSVRNEFVSSSRRRTNYDNLFWRDDLSERITIGSQRRSSLGASLGSPGLTQSCWPLDAHREFLTKTGSIVGYSMGRAWGTGSHWIPTQLVDIGSALYIRSTASSGELQNPWYFAHFVEDGGAAIPNLMLRPAPLYARKHMLGGYRSVVSPSGMVIPETGSFTDTTGAWNQIESNVFVNTGEAFWETGDHAGIVVASGSKSTDGLPPDALSQYKFKSYKSKPWYDNYSEFRDDIRLMAKDYVIVPEYRISQHVNDYIRYGVNNEEKFDTFEIPGTGITSATSSFYKDYTNSEYLKYFRSTGEKIPGMTAKEIRISVKAVKKFNPYKGFYPVQRTLDLAAQFSASYFPSLHGWYGDDGVPSIIGANFGTARPVVATLFAPGIMYNSIKSGMAVDYPIVENGSGKTNKLHRHPNADPNLHLWAIKANDNATATGSNVWRRGDPFWDERLPFETIIRPDIYLDGLEIVDMEPHPSCSTYTTAALMSTEVDQTYTLMARNFFGEVANFFLTDADYTTLKSGLILNNNMTFKTGTYGARLKLYRSCTGPRSFWHVADGFGQVQRNSAYGKLGGRYLDASPGDAPEMGAFVTGSIYPLPQDPNRTGSQTYGENFTMYSRPTAFGPPVSGRKFVGAPGAEAIRSASAYGIKDCYNGFNWSFTPPYYNGEAWVDFIFRPDSTRVYSVQEVLNELETYYWRVDPGPVIEHGVHDGGVPSAEGPHPALISASYTYRNIYDGFNVNLHAMQISASFNLFGIENTIFQETDAYGTTTAVRNEARGTQWVIKPKFETPMLNFNSQVQPVSDAANTLSVPTFGSGTVPRGMWHQFGLIEPDEHKGIFMQMGDIPKNWLKYHYLVNTSASVYNNYLGETAAYDAEASIRKAKNMKSLAGALNFDTTAKRLGQIATKTVVKEAVVAIPFVYDPPPIDTYTPGPESSIPSTKAGVYKRFFSIPEKRIKAALKNNASSKAGKSLQAAGESIRKLVAKMDNYILPPQFDFLRNPDVKPVVMYIFEFSYEFDQDDLSYIWQNIAPRNYKKVTFEEQAIAHRLNKTQLLTAEELMTHDVRWMIFKIKQRATGDYYSHIPSQTAGTLSPGETLAFDPAQATAGLSLGKAFGTAPIASGEYPLQFNWPYDYLSFVEGIKVDVEVLFDDETNRTRSLVRELESKQTLSYGVEKSFDTDLQETAEIIASTANAVPRSPGGSRTPGSHGSGLKVPIRDED